MSSSLNAIPRVTRAIDRFALFCGRLVAWLIVPMVLSLVYEVVARYFFNMPTVWAYDMTFILYGTFFMLGSAYTLMKKGHIRTDMLYASWSPRRQGITDAICYLVFLPFSSAAPVVCPLPRQVRWPARRHPVFSYGHPGSGLKRPF
jgi:TRAP-type mannitol/chloroaromatic compound transport system permease small subunit